MWAAFLFKLLLVSVAVILCVHGENAKLADGINDTPDVLSYNSPLRRPESLKSQQYFDFLNTLYRHDASKSNLFSSFRSNNSQKEKKVSFGGSRRRRALTFRPLFVYRQLHNLNREAN